MTITCSFGQSKSNRHDRITKEEFQDLLKDRDNFVPADLRSGPGTDYEKLKTLEKGTEIYVIDDSKEWVKVRANWKEGYIHKDYIQPTE